jgi:diguanylate cyclase (GGDEF)-like protein
MIRRSVDRQYQEFENTAVTLVESYSRLFGQSYEAYSTITEVLDEKLIVASQAIMYMEGSKDNEFLTELAKRFRIDEIYVYDSSGEIRFSNNPKYIGWKAYEGHPVYDFMVSDDDLLIEDIRPDSESGINYKYAYFQNTDGSFTQIGILAETVQGFLNQFEYQEMVESLAEREGIEGVFFVDNAYQVVASSDERYLGYVIDEPEIKQQMDMDNYHMRRFEWQEGRILLASIPEKHQGEKHGNLVIAWSTAPFDREVKRIIKFALQQFAFILLFVGGILFYAYRKYRSNIKLAYYDRLTGLPNQAYLSEYLEDAIKGKPESSALLLLQLNNLPILRMTYGATYADRLLIQIVQSTQTVIGQSERIFDYGSDRFIVVTHSFKDSEDLVELAKEIIAVSKNLHLGGFEHQNVDIEIGILEIEHDDISVEKLLQRANLTLSDTDKGHYTPIRFFKEGMQEQLVREDRIEKALRALVEGKSNGSFFLQFQPKLDIRQQQITGFESLARLQLSDLGSISPLEFIDIAERRLLIYELGKLVLQHACGFVQALHNRGYQSMGVAVNVSVAQLLREEFVEDLKGIVNSYDIDMHALEIEITESMLFENFNLVNEKLSELQQLGITVSLDDFGTGYSSLSRLRELNVNVVKIDRSFVEKIKDVSDSHAIIGDIISMAHKAELVVVAEGVETQEQLAYLQRNECDIVQGYYFSRPMDSVAAFEFLERFSSKNTP